MIKQPVLAIYVFDDGIKSMSAFLLDGAGKTALWAYPTEQADNEDISKDRALAQLDKDFPAHNMTIIEDSYLLKSLAKVHLKSSPTDRVKHMQPTSHAALDFLVREYVIGPLRELEGIRVGVLAAIETYHFKTSPLIKMFDLYEQTYEAAALLLEDKLNEHETNSGTDRRAPLDKLTANRA